MDTCISIVVRGYHVDLRVMSADLVGEGREGFIAYDPVHWIYYGQGGTWQEAIAQFIVDNFIKE